MAAQALLDRHPNLRVAVDTARDAVVQIVCDRITVPWREIDARAGDAAAEFARIAAAERATPFDTAVAPLVRFTLVRLEDRQWRLLLTNHHILLDGWSIPLLVSELLQLYAGGDRPAPRSYRDFLEWLARQDHSASVAVWQQALTGVDEPTLLAPRAADVPPPRDHLIELDEPGTARLVELSTRLGVTVNSVLQAAWAIVLSRSTAHGDVVFGATVSGRPPQLSGIEEMLGLFINTVPVRIRVRPGETVATLLRRVQDEQAALLDHHHVGLTEIRRSRGLRHPGARARRRRADCDLDDRPGRGLHRSDRTDPAARPYRIAGWSFGCTAAHAIAAELQRRGHQVALLAVIDGLPATGDSAAAGAEPSEQELSAAMRAWVGARYGEMADSAEYRQIADAVLAVMRNNRRMLLDYRSPEYRGDAVVFRAGLSPDGTPATESYVGRWSAVIHGSITEYVIHSVHDDMDHPEPSARIGGLLAALLEAGDTAASA